jgi:hypothetical protein
MSTGCLACRHRVIGDAHGLSVLVDAAEREHARNDDGGGSDLPPPPSWFFQT